MERIPAQRSSIARTSLWCAAKNRLLQEPFDPLAQNLADDLPIYFSAQVFHHDTHKRAEATLPPFSDVILPLLHDPIADLSDRLGVYCLDTQHFDSLADIVTVLQNGGQYLRDGFLGEGASLEAGQEILHPIKAPA